MVAQRFRPAVADSFSGSIPQFPQAMAPCTKSNYRFTVGTRVTCKMDEWRIGTIIALDYKEANWPRGKVAPYQVELDVCAYSHMHGPLIYVPADDDRIREIVSRPIPALLSGFPIYYKSPEFATWLSSITASDDAPVDAGAAAALDAIYGRTWTDQLENERRYDGSFARNLKEFYFVKLRYNYPS